MEYGGLPSLTRVSLVLSAGLPSPVPLGSEPRCTALCTCSHLHSRLLCLPFPTGVLLSRDSPFQGPALEPSLLPEPQTKNYAHHLTVTWNGLLKGTGGSRRSSHSQARGLLAGSTHQPGPACESQPAHSTVPGQWEAESTHGRWGQWRTTSRMCLSFLLSSWAWSGPR